MQVGESLPYQTLGFHSTTALLEAIPDVCSLQQRNGTLMVVGLASSGTAHILNMVTKVPVFKCKKMALRAPKQKNRDHFLSPTTPQNGKQHVCFMRIAFLGGF